MSTKNKHFLIPVLITVILLLVAGGGLYVYQSKDVDISIEVISDEVPHIIRSVETDPETGYQHSETNSQILEQVKKDVQNGKLAWFTDPLEVSKKYGNLFGITNDFQYSLQQPATFGDYSGSMHSKVLATNSKKSYTVNLISDTNQPYVWVINGVDDIQKSAKLRVRGFMAASTFDTDGIGHQEIVDKFNDGSTMFYLNLKKPIVSFSVNVPAKPSTVNSNSIIVKANNTILKGATANAITEQGSYNELTFPMYTIKVDLTNIPNLRNYVGQNVQIILTDKIKDNSNNSLQQCRTSYNKGECIADVNGQKISAYGAELKLYSI